MLLELANVVLSLAKRDGISVTPMKLVKLCYIINGWHLGFHGKPLFYERIEAWKYGPVMPDLYRATKHYGRNNISFNDVSDFERVKDTMRYSTEELDFIERAYNVYKDKTAIELSMLTHKADSPWYQVYEAGVSKIEIPVSLIKAHYDKKISQFEATQA